VTDARLKVLPAREFQRSAFAVKGPIPARIGNKGYGPGISSIVERQSQTKWAQIEKEPARCMMYDTMIVSQHTNTCPLYDVSYHDCYSAHEFMSFFSL
jgi:hypothetical protein